MKIVLVLVIAISASGCAYYGATTEPAAVVTKQEVEATNARTQCRALARNLVQMARCDGR